MPSFWNWLCFNKKRYDASGSGDDRSKKLVKGKRKRDSDDDGSDSVTLNKRRLIDTNYGENEGGTFEGSQDHNKDESAQRLFAKARSRKRRKLTDIFKKDTTREFNWPSEVHVAATSQRPPPHNLFPDTHANNFDAFRNNSHHNGNGSNRQEVSASRLSQSSNSDSYNFDSMYGYVPKATQNIYASTALQGQRIDDYFTDCRQDNALTKFAPPERVQTSAFPIKKRFTSNTSRQGTERELLLDNGSTNYNMASGTTGDFFQWQERTSKQNWHTPPRGQNVTQVRDIRPISYSQPLSQTPVREVRPRTRIPLENMWKSSGDVLY